MYAKWHEDEQLRYLEDWAVFGKKNDVTLLKVKEPVRVLTMALREARERNEILTKVLVEAAARAVDLRPIAPANEPTGQTPAGVALGDTAALVKKAGDLGMDLS